MFENGHKKSFDFHGLIGQRFKEEISVLSRLLSQRLKRFVVINFELTTLEIVYVESLPEGLRVLAYDTGRSQALEFKRREADFVEFIKSFLSKNAVTSHEVLISFSDSESILFKDIVLPIIPESEILEAARWQFKEDIPFDLEQASIDWQVLEEVTGEDGQKGQRIIFVVANNALIYQYLSIVQQCRLDLLNVTNSAFNYCHILENLPDVPAVAAILDIRRKETTFGIYGQKKLNFVRRLPLSWEKFIQSLTKTLVSDEGATQLTLEQAEEIARSVGIPQQNTEVIAGNIKTSHFLSLMRPFLETLTREMKFSLDYYEINFGKGKPLVLYIIGEGVHLKHLDQYIYTAFGIQTTVLPMPARIDMQGLGAAASEIEGRGAIMNLLGAALGGLTQINLLPIDVKNKRLELLEKILFRSLTIIISVVVTCSLFVMWFQINNYESRLRIAKIHMETMINIKGLADDVSARESLSLGIEEKQIPLDGILKAMSVITPTQIVLDSLDFNSITHQLILRGSLAANREAADAVLADFMKRIQASIFFTRARFVSSQKIGIVYAFEIECDISH